MTTTDLDACLQLVANRRRRRVLRYVRDDPAETVTVDELVDAVSRADTSGADEPGPALDRRRLAV